MDISKVLLNDENKPKIEKKWLYLTVICAVVIIAVITAVVLLQLGVIDKKSQDIVQTQFTPALTPVPEPQVTKTPAVVEPTHETVSEKRVVPDIEFTGEPNIGPAPLEVKFTSHNEGCGEDYIWDFGDSTTAKGLTASHVYPFPGKYDVSLSATCKETGTKLTLKKEGYVYVNTTKSGRYDCYMYGDRDAYFLSGGIATFTVTSENAAVRIGGKFVKMPPGSNVEFTIESESPGDISVTNNAITSFSFNNLTMSIDSKEVGKGLVDSIIVYGYDDFKTCNINLVIPEDTNGISGFITDNIYFDGNEKTGVELQNIGIDSAGQLVTDTDRKNVFSVKGAVASFHLGEIPTNTHN